MSQYLNESFPATPVRVLIADDHPMIRSGIATLLDRVPGFQLAGQASDGAEALALALDLVPDLILMDLKMPGTDGLDAIREIRTRLPKLNIIVLTSFDDEEDIFQALHLGAKAYLLKSGPIEEFVQCLKVVAGGRTFVPSEIGVKLTERLRAVQLTARELEILRFLASGGSNKTIARTIGIGEGTVKFHINNILGKLCAGNRTEAVAIGMKRGLVARPV